MKKILKKLPRHIVLIFLLLFMLYPIFMVITNAFKSESELYSNSLGLPSDWGLSNFVTAFRDGHLAQAFLSSIAITVVSVTLITLLGSFAAFAISRSNMIGRRKWYWLFIVGIMIPYQVGLLHLYRLMDGLKLVDTFPGIVLIYVAYGLPFTVFVMYGFFRSIPNEINEAATVDGCNVFQNYAKIIMPLSPTVIAAVVIFNLVWIWNDMLFPLIFISSPELKTLARALLGFKGQFLSRYTVMFAGVVMASIPLTIVYLLLQKRFISGMTAGSVKG